MGANTEIITANRTDDGSVVYLSGERRWQPDIATARVHREAEARDAELSWARGDQAVVCDPYVLTVCLDDGSVPVPDSARERLRAAGPDRVLQTFGYE